MFRRVLIANRGEIAARIARSLRELEVESAVLCAPSEHQTPSVLLADVAVAVDDAEARSIFLDPEALVALAREHRCDAVHPGYGFLSESPDFAELCERSGVTFIGPSADAIRAMGTKVLAREAMARAGVPVVPGGSAADLTSAVRTANDLGYPVMLKAVHGGGGKGMRKVENAQQLGQVFSAAEDEAKRAFGQGDLYLEKEISPARHVEIQVLGDRRGNTVHLFERDCSLQRRHQKIVEETPCPVLSAATVAAMGDIAVRGARALGYYSAGTFEFLVGPDGSFYFLEMNTRLQVEHPITEWVTGLDLVREMVRIAAGEPLDFEPASLARRGAAIECRIYAEDPSEGFRPAPGRIVDVRYPLGPGVRVDEGAVRGNVISADFDPMIAKISTWGRDRGEAVSRMRRALFETAFVGITTNLGFLCELLIDRAFVQGDYDTGFIERRAQERTSAHAPRIDSQAVAVAAAAAAHRATGRFQQRTRETALPMSPWVLAQRQRHARRGY